VRALRLLAVGLRFHVKTLTLSTFFLITSVFMPVLVATVAFYMFKAGGRPGTLFYASLGAAGYGIWSSTLFGSGGGIQWQRWQGTLEVLVSTPVPFIAFFAGTMTIANERHYQTLPALLATPANRFAVFMGRSLPVLASGLLVSAWGFVMGRLLLDFHPPLASIPRSPWSSSSASRRAPSSG
jgi:ABC-type Na+ efflux pump permease subunit